jgi:hypothetical protein
VHRGFWWGNLRERPLGKPILGGRIILKPIFQKFDGKAWTGLMWLRLATCGGLL